MTLFGDFRNYITRYIIIGVVENCKSLTQLIAKNDMGICRLFYEILQPFLGII